MGIERKTKEIGAFQYELETFGAKQSMGVLLTLFRFLGPGLSEAIEADESFSDKAVAKAIRTFAMSARSEDLFELVEAFAGKITLLMPTTTKAGSGFVKTKLGPIWDAHFAGHLPDLLSLLTWATVENYQSFFGGTIKGVVEKLRAQQAAGVESQSPPESTGS